MDGIARTYGVLDAQNAWLIHTTDEKVQQQSHRCQSSLVLHPGLLARISPFHTKPIFQVVLCKNGCARLIDERLLHVSELEFYAIQRKHLVLFRLRRCNLQLLLSLRKQLIFRLLVRWNQFLLLLYSSSYFLWKHLNWWIEFLVVLESLSFLLIRLLTYFLVLWDKFTHFYCLER